MIRLAVKAGGSEVFKTMAKYTKRRDKRGYEWKSAYREKEALMLERGYPEVSPHDFYTLTTKDNIFFLLFGCF